MGKLDGKVAVVTGGSSGIGFEIARALAAEGARIVIFGRRKEALTKAVQSLGGNVLGVCGDVTRVGDIDHLYEQVRSECGGLDIVVASAGSAGPTPLATCTEKEFDDLMALNVRGVFFTVQKSLPLLRAQASIVVIGSVAGEITLSGASVYCASKAAVEALVRVWGSELGPLGIRVNLLGPGVTETPLVDRLQAHDGGMDAFDAMIKTRTFLGRRGQAAEIASAALFLCSPDSSYMTGGAIYVDGGMAQM
jgi:NAD(P)-dependent dehydrogenase (short-subunit alcohol dehydrogenase family)